MSSNWMKKYFYVRDFTFEKKLEAIKENIFRKIYLDILLFLSHKIFRKCEKHTTAAFSYFFSNVVVVAVCLFA